MQGPRVIVSIPYNSDPVVIDAPLQVGALRRTAILIGDIELCVGGFAHSASDTELVAFCDSMGAAFDEIRGAAAGRLNREADKGNHYAGLPPYDAVGVAAGPGGTQ